MKIQQHTDLEVYKKGFDAAMLIFWASKNFPKEETYSLMIRSGVLRVPSVQIWLKLGGSVGKRQLLFPNCPMPKAKLPKPRSGSNSR